MKVEIFDQIRRVLNKFNSFILPLAAEMLLNRIWAGLSRSTYAPPLCVPMFESLDAAFAWGIATIYSVGNVKRSLQNGADASRGWSTAIRVRMDSDSGLSCRSQSEPSRAAGCCAEKKDPAVKLPGAWWWRIQTVRVNYRMNRSQSLWFFGLKYVYFPPNYTLMCLIIKIWPDVLCALLLNPKSSD